MCFACSLEKFRAISFRIFFPFQGGGSYGTFGGYDITLIELTAAVPPTFGKPACLPTVSFKDTLIKANLAGYGQFYRRDMSGEDVQKCLTDQYGRNKYHPCAESGTGETVCHTKTPPPQAPACQAFFNQTALAYPEEYEEIQLVDKKGETIAFCFDKVSPVPKSRGWCKTDANYYNFKEVAEEGWGFCSGDCYLGDIKVRVENTVNYTFSNEKKKREKSFSDNFPVIFVEVFTVCKNEETYFFPRYAYTDKIENKNFLMYKEIQMGSVAKSYMRKGAPLNLRNAHIVNHI